MTGIIKIAGVALISVVLVLIVKEYRREFAFQISLAAIAIIMLLIVGTLTDVLDAIKNLIEKYSVGVDLFGTILKIIGVAYIAQLAAQICLDAGEGAIAVKVEMAGRVLLIAAALPMCIGVLDIITELISGVTG